MVPSLFIGTQSTPNSRHPTKQKQHVAEDGCSPGSPADAWDVEESTGIVGIEKASICPSKASDRQKLCFSHQDSLSHTLVHSNLVNIVKIGTEDKETGVETYTPREGWPSGSMA